MRAVVLIAAVALLAAGCGPRGGETTEAVETQPIETQPVETQPVETATTPEGSGCTSVEAPAPREPGELEPPEGELDASVEHRLVVTTNCGTFTVTLDLESAPATSASLVALAEDGYFDDTVFHRIVPGFVIQGGDPTQSGSGGPGYQTVDAPAEAATYTKGVVAMAKTEVETAGTSGSQFFVVTGEDIGLPPDYAIVGTVTDGLDVVELIGTLGDPATEQPTQPVVIQSVTVEQG